MDLWHLFKHPDQFLMAFEGSDAIFVEMDRDAYHRSIFCDRRISPATGRQIKIQCAELFEFNEQNFSQTPDLSYIFHMAHCGSTLLSRALDIKETNLVYREPLALRQLGVEAASTFYGEVAPESWRRRVNLITTLLGRSYNHEGSVIVKANVPVNFMIPQLLDAATDVRGILLYFTFENYLLAILKSPTHRGWIVNVATELNRGIGVVTKVRQNLTLPQVAACLWLTQVIIFSEILSSYPQVKSLHAESLFNDPRHTLQHAFRYFGQTVDESVVDKIVSGELFSRYSKNPQRKFNNDARLAQRRAIQKEIGHEIEEARNWIERQAGMRQLPKKLTSSLVGGSVDLLMPT